MTGYTPDHYSDGLSAAGMFCAAALDGRVCRRVMMVHLCSSSARFNVRPFGDFLEK